MAAHEVTIKDRVRIALAFTILGPKEPDMDLETCILRFRDRFPRSRSSYRQRRCNRKPNNNEQYENADETEASRIRWQAKIKTMQEEVESLTKQLAERDADISVLHTDLEATQGTGKQPAKKKQKKTGLALGPAVPGAGAGPGQPPNVNPDSVERDGPEVGAGESAARRKTGKGGMVKGSGQEGQEAVLQVLAKKLDETWEQATNEINSTKRTAGLLIKLFDAPTDLGHEFLPLRLQAIFLHAQDLVQTCSIYLEASVEAALYPSLAEVKKSLSSRVQYPGRMVQIITLLLQNVLPALSRAIGDIVNELDGLPGFDHAEVGARWNEMILLIGKKVVIPAIEILKKTSDIVFAQQQRPQRERTSRTRFMQSSIAQIETNRRDIRESLVKLLLTLTRCEMSVKVKEDPGSTRGTSIYPLAEIIAFKATIELVSILKPEPNGRHAPRPFEERDHARQERSADHETVRVLLVILRSSAPYLPCYTSDNISHGKQRSGHLVEVFMKRGPEETLPERQDALFPPMNLLLGMTIRSQLVQLLSPIVQPITSALYDCFSEFKSPAQQASSLLDDRALRKAFMQVAEELMLAEGDEQAGIGEWVIDQIDAEGMKINEKEEEAEAEHAAEPNAPAMPTTYVQDSIDKGDSSSLPALRGETREAVIENPVARSNTTETLEALPEEPETLFSFSMSVEHQETPAPIAQTQSLLDKSAEQPLIDFASASPSLIAIPPTPAVEVSPASAEAVALTAYDASPPIDPPGEFGHMVNQHAPDITPIAMMQNGQPLMALHQDSTSPRLARPESQPNPLAHNDMSSPPTFADRPETQ